MPALFTITEIVELIITVLALGYIFSGMIRKPKGVADMMFENRFFDWENIKYSMAVVAPAVIIHELGHKFIAVALGYSATYHMVSWGLGLGVILRLIGSSFIFFIPGYVAIAGIAGITKEFSYIALAGPLVNLTLFFISWGVLRANIYTKLRRAFYISKQINLWLFGLNMIPIAMFDGAKVLKGFWQLYVAVIGLAALGIWATFKLDKKAFRF